MWKRLGSDKPQQSAGAWRGLDGSKWQQTLARYKQEVARSSRAPPISGVRLGKTSGIIHVT